MPAPIMFDEGAFLYSSSFTAPRTRRFRGDRLFETMAAMEGVDIDRLEPSVVRKAKEKCTQCACRGACRHWLRTGVFKYEGDPRCPNAALLRQ